MAKLDLRGGSTGGGGAGGGTTDGATGKLLVTPTANSDNAIIVKSPNSTWGVSQSYGAGQAFMFLKDAAAPTDIGYVGTTPDDLVMTRLDNVGNLGLCGGVHIATGLRQKAGFTANYAVQVQPRVDTVQIQLVGVAGQTSDVMNFYDSNAVLRWRLLPTGSAEVGKRTSDGHGLLVGDLGGGGADFFGVCHTAVDKTNGFALQQSGAGDTFLNAVTGRTVTIRVNNTARLSVTATGMGFNGTAAIAKPTVTGAKGSNAALASLMTALANYGLVVDSTTA